MSETVGANEFNPEAQAGCAASDIDCHSVVVPFLVSGGDRNWVPRHPALFPTHKGRLVESIAELLKHPVRSRGQRGRLCAAEVERLDAAYERAAR